MKLNITQEVVRVCPLRCSTCPMGRREIPLSNARLDPDELQRRLGHLSRFYRLHNISLYNWNDPGAHPELPALIRIAKRFGKTLVACSGNIFNFPLKDLVAAQPDSFTIPFSGWTQEIYKVGHEGGDVEVVKDACRQLRGLGMKRGAFINFHRYDNNLHEEAPVKAFAKELGWRYMAVWAWQMPVEALVDGVDDPHVILSVKERLALCGPQTHCPIQADLVLTIEGDVRLCTAVRSMEAIGRWDDPLTLLNYRKLHHEYCKKCMGCGATAVVCCLNPKLDRACCRKAGMNTLGERWRQFKKQFWVKKEYPTSL